ncbi:unnamed protein product [Orchesella dallaii]|uniref:Uncharacterized protein n=1 Tax=Orchesella dallaii TaxID=48710 RepID=A0ABP1PTR8_9HEXA
MVPVPVPSSVHPTFVECSVLTTLQKKRTNMLHVEELRFTSYRGTCECCCVPWHYPVCSTPIAFCLERGRRIPDGMMAEEPGHAAVPTYGHALWNHWTTRVPSPNITKHQTSNNHGMEIKMRSSENILLDLWPISKQDLMFGVAIKITAIF